MEHLNDFNRELVGSRSRLTQNPQNLLKYSQNVGLQFLASGLSKTAQKPHAFLEKYVVFVQFSCAFHFLGAFHFICFSWAFHFSGAFTFEVCFSLFRCFSLSRCVFHVFFTFQVFFTFHLLFMGFSPFRCFSLLKCVFHVLFTFQVLSLLRCAFHVLFTFQVCFSQMHHIHIHAPYAHTCTTKCVHRLPHAHEVL